MRPATAVIASAVIVSVAGTLGARVIRTTAAGIIVRTVFTTVNYYLPVTRFG